MTVTKNYDSEFCGRLPLHQINLIQDYGWLFVVRRSDLTIIQASENVQPLLNMPAEDLVNMHLSDLVDEKLIEVLKTRKQSEQITRIPIAFHLKNAKQPNEMLCLVHVKKDYFILEIEQLQPQRKYFVDVYEKVRLITAELQTAKSTEEVCIRAVKEIKKISGFDKVMIYHFDAQWNGDVIAEAGEEGMPAYLGLKFPASDVPKQARDLYLKNPYRLIPDRNYEPIKLYPVINPVTQGFIDLSDCNVRGVAAVHLEYLKNMGVTASMSVRILKDEKLWGLIACHHREKKYLDFETCSLLEIISNFLSEKIAAIINSEQFELKTEIQSQRVQLTDKLYASGDITEGLLADNKLLEMFKASGAAVCTKNRIRTIGVTPAKDEIENIIFWLQSKNYQNVYSNNIFSSVYENAADYVSEVSGILVIPVRPEKGEIILIFRPEVIQTVKWGGNPDEAIQFEPDKKHYHPRNSFEQWKQTLRATALPWHEAEIAAAEQLRSAIYEFSTRQLN